MRLIYVLLVAATTLLAICDATPVNMKKASLVGGPDVAEQKDNSKASFLRARSVDSEERAFSLKNIFGNPDFARSKLKKTMRDEKFELAMVKKWDEKYTVGQIRGKLKIDEYHPKLLFNYLNKFKKNSPVKSTGNANVRFDANPPQVKTIDEIDKALEAIAKVAQ